MSKSFPEKSERLICWGARDQYFNCLDKNNDREDACSKLKEAFENSCPKTWVKYFDRKRRYEKFKEDYNQKGWFEPMEEPKS